MVIVVLVIINISQWKKLKIMQRKVKKGKYEIKCLMEYLKKQTDEAIDKYSDSIQSIKRNGFLAEINMAKGLKIGYREARKLINEIYKILGDNDGNN